MYVVAADRENQVAHCGDCESMDRAEWNMTQSIDSGPVSFFHIGESKPLCASEWTSQLTNFDFWLQICFGIIYKCIF